MSEIETRHDEMFEQFQAFHRAHPEVWMLFVRFTWECINRGFKHYSAQGIYERIRWESAGGDGSGYHFKLNNNHRPFYSRRFMDVFPEHEGFFRTRVQTSKGDRPTNLPPLTPEDFPTYPNEQRRVAP